MCQVCKEAEALPLTEAIELIGKKINEGSDAAHFDSILDKLLGTVQAAEDDELAEAWERSHRGS